MKKTLRTLLLLALAPLFGLVGHVAAATNAPQPQPSSTQGGLALTPAIQDKVLGPTEKSVSFTVLLSNQSDKPVTFTLSTTDFNALNQTGGLTFLGTDSRRVSNGHGLSGILQLDTKLVTIAANSSKQVTATVPDVSKLAPGGHYGAILAQALPDGKPIRGNQVAINQVLSSLLFLETAGQGTKTLALLPPSISNMSFALPSNLDLAFKATGNTQTIPRGRATIVRGDKEIMQGIINENSSLLLPGSTRLLPTELIGDRQPIRPGFYTLRVEYRFEGSLGVTTYEKKFLYVNIQAILLAVLALILVAYGLIRSRKFWKRLSQAASMPMAMQRRLIVVRNRSQAPHKITVKTTPKPKPKSKPTKKVKKTAVTEKTDL